MQRWAARGAPPKRYADRVAKKVRASEISLKAAKTRARNAAFRAAPYPEPTEVVEWRRPIRDPQVDPQLLRERKRQRTKFGPRQWRHIAYAHTEYEERRIELPFVNADDFVDEWIPRLTSWALSDFQRLRAQYPTFVVQILWHQLFAGPEAYRGSTAIAISLRKKAARGAFTTRWSQSGISMTDEGVVSAFHEAWQGRSVEDYDTSASGKSRTRTVLVAEVRFRFGRELDEVPKARRASRSRSKKKKPTKKPTKKRGRR